MENRRKQGYFSGSITVFLSLAGIVILALLCTLLEGAYVDAGRIYGEGVTAMCSEGVSHLYEKELWEDYGLLAFADEQEGELVLQELEMLLQANLSGEYLSEKTPEKGGIHLSLLPLAMGLPEIETKKYLLEDEGKWYAREVSSLMKEETKADILEHLKEALESFSGASVCMKVLQAEMEAEESLKAMVKDMQELTALGKKLDTEPVKQLQELVKTIKSINWQEGISEKQRKEIKKSFSNIQKGCKSQAEYLGEMLEVLEDIQKQAGTAKDAITAFADALKECKSLLNKETYQEFQEKLSQLKNYMGMGEKKEINNLLKRSKSALDAVAEASADMLEETDAAGLEEMFEKWEEQVSGYHPEEIRQMLPEEAATNEEKSNPLTTLQNLLKNGILELVTETEEIGKGSLLSEEETNGKEEEEGGEKKGKEKEEKESEGLENFFSQAEELSFDTKALSGFSDENGLLPALETAGKKTIEKVMLCRYGVVYFSSYTKQDSLKRVLSYETEYQIAGKNSDKENLSAVVNRLAFIRTAMNFVYVKRNQEMKAEAAATAAALAGIAGLSAFTSIIENALLLGLAYEEAILDVAGMLKNKRIPFLKTEETFAMKFQQMPMFGKEFIQEKTKTMPDEEEGIRAGFSYEDYLQILLLTCSRKNIMKRQWCLIEKNLQLRYSPEYSLKDSLYSVSGKVSAYLPKKFIRGGFLPKREKQENDKAYSYEFSWGFSYE